MHRDLVPMDGGSKDKIINLTKILLVIVRSLPYVGTMLNVQEVLWFKGMRQDTVAARLDIHPSGFSYRCRGMRKMPVGDIIKLAELLEVPVDDVARAFDQIYQEHGPRKRLDVTRPDPVRQAAALLSWENPERVTKQRAAIKNAWERKRAQQAQSHEVG